MPIEVVASALIKNSQDQILFIQSRNWAGKWILPHSSLIPKQNIFSSLETTVKKDLNLEIACRKIIKIGGTVNPPFFYRPARFIGFDIECDLIAGEIKLNRNSYLDYRWEDPGNSHLINLAPRYDEALSAYLKSI